MERIEIGSRNRDNSKIGQQQTILKTMERLDESDCQGCFEVVPQVGTAAADASTGGLELHPWPARRRQHA
jgi:hypothetical protein